MSLDIKTSAQQRRLGELSDSEWLCHRQIQIERGLRAAHRERAVEMRRCFNGLVGLLRR